MIKSRNQVELQSNKLPRVWTKSVFYSTYLLSTLGREGGIYFRGKKNSIQSTKNRTGYSGLELTAKSSSVGQEVAIGVTAHTDTSIAVFSRFPLARNRLLPIGVWMIFRCRYYCWGRRTRHCPRCRCARPRSARGKNGHFYTAKLHNQSINQSTNQAKNSTSARRKISKFEVIKWWKIIQKKEMVRRNKKMFTMYRLNSHMFGEIIRKKDTD